MFNGCSIHYIHVSLVCVLMFANDDLTVKFDVIHPIIVEYFSQDHKCEKMNPTENPDFQ